jgi:hypothetical protein
MKNWHFYFFKMLPGFLQLPFWLKIRGIREMALTAINDN